MDIVVVHAEYFTVSHYIAAKAIAYNNGVYVITKADNTTTEYQASTVLISILPM